MDGSPTATGDAFARGNDTAAVDESQQGVMVVAMTKTIVGPWQIDANNRHRKGADGSVIATVRMLDGDGYAWTAGSKGGVESASDKCYVNHEIAVKAANAALVEQGYTLFESVATPDREEERKQWARAYKANEDVFIAVMFHRVDPAAERAERSAAQQALRDLGVDVDAVLKFTAG